MEEFDYAYASYLIAPWGDKRADMRATVHTLALAAAFRHQEIDPEDLDYLPTAEEVDAVVATDAARAAADAMNVQRALGLGTFDA